ncbi:MAG: polysaccharide biosynthesis C-terminal domain-containing protein [Saccharofermentans sp.]|nr:polysaccharide biosynthesis C-terminal domain-containing protein [Saccharofermentans sp.]
MKEKNKVNGFHLSVWSVIKIVAPSIFTFVFIAAYQMVDGIFIERYVGDLAISATNLFYPILGLFAATGIMLGTGGNAMIVKHVGEGNSKKAGQVFSELLIFTLIISAAITAVCLLFSDPIMELCGATAGNIEFMRPYYMVMCTFSFAIIMQSMLGILIIGEGKTTVAAIVIMVGGTLNCVLDYVFMKVFGMGIKGAAIATVIGYTSTIVYAVYYYLIARRSSYKIELCKINIKEIGTICFNGSSDMVSNLAGGVTALFMNHLAFKYYGEIGVSALSVWSYVQFLIIAVFMGYVSAIEPMFSFLYGKGDVPMRRKLFKISMVWSVVIGAVVFVLVYAFRAQLIGIFFAEGTEFFTIAEYGLVVSLIASLAVGVNTFASGLFTAFSNGGVSFVLSMVRTFLILTVFLYLLTYLWGGIGLWLAWPAAEFASLIPSAIALIVYKDKYKYT